VSLHPQFGPAIKQLTVLAVAYFPIDIHPISLYPLPVAADFTEARWMRPWGEYMARAGPLAGEAYSLSHIMSGMPVGWDHQWLLHARNDRDQQLHSGHKLTTLLRQLNSLKTVHLKSALLDSNNGDLGVNANSETVSVVGRTRHADYVSRVFQATMKAICESGSRLEQLHPFSSFIWYKMESTAITAVTSQLDTAALSTALLHVKDFAISTTPFDQTILQP